MEKSTIVKYLKRVLFGYILYAVLFSTFPYVIQPDLNTRSQEEIQSKILNSETEYVDRAYLLENSQEALAVRINMIRQSEEYLDIVYHLIHYDDTSAAFLSEVYDAAERGVQVRILLDGKTSLFSYKLNGVLKEMNRHENIEIRKYNTVSLLTPWKWHVLLHDKFMIADNKYLVLGGRNIGDRYYMPQEYDATGVFDRDVLVICENPEDESSVIQEVNLYMDMIFYHKDSSLQWLSFNRGNGSIEKIQKTAFAYEAVNPGYYNYIMDYFYEAALPVKQITLLYNPLNTGIKEPEIGYGLMLLAQEAKEQVLVQTPYMTANSNMLQVFYQIGEHKELELITNSLASSPNYPAFSNYFVNREKFMNAGMDIYEYQSTNSIHGKSFVFDNEISVVGSFNLDDRSIYIDTETMLIIESEEFAGVLKEAIEDIKDSSLKVGEDNRYLPQDFIEEIVVEKGKKAGMYIASIFSRIFQFLI